MKRTSKEDCIVTRLANIILCVAFIIALFLPLLNVDNRLDLDPLAPLVELRVLAPLPVITIDAGKIARLPSSFEAYYNDHFGFRNALVRLNSLADVLLFNDSPSADVVIGLDGWLYYAGVGSTTDHQGLQPLTNEQLMAAQEFLRRRTEILAINGATYVFVIVPNKQSVYPEYLPAAQRRAYGPTRLEQFSAYMHAHSDLQPVDLTEALLDGKSLGPLYFKTDSHWNPMGAWVGYNHIVKHLSRFFPLLSPTALNEIEFSRSGDCCSGLATMMGVSGVYPLEALNQVGISHYRVRTETVQMDNTVSATITRVDDPNLPTAIVVCDSFCDAFLKVLLSQHFRQAIFVRPVALEYDPMPLVLKYHPDVVVTEVVERHFPFALGVNLP